MTNPDDTESEKAYDAIPVGSVRLSEAYSRILDVVCANPHILPDLDEDWCSALEKSRRLEQTVNDPTVFDDELADFWHQKKRVNVFLRQCLEERQLVPCVRDPETGETLALLPGEWLPLKWEHYVPPGIWDDYIDPDDYDSPGPLGSFIRGALRPVFFEKANFFQWFEKRFGTTISTASTSPEQVIEPVHVPKAHKLAAAQEALREVYGKEINVIGVSIRTRSNAINAWLVARGKDKVGDSTIRRALAQLRKS